MARPRKRTETPAAGKRRVQRYDHKGRRRQNSPPVGLVTEAAEGDTGSRKHAYDRYSIPR